MGTILTAILDVVFPRTDTEYKLSSMTADKLARECPRSEPIETENCFAALSYRHPITRQLIREVKYQGNSKSALMCAEILYDLIISELAESAAFINFGRPLLLAMPLARDRAEERGFNQSSLIAQFIASIDGERNLNCCFVDDVLLKTKNTLPQTALAGRSERLSNLRGCFRVVQKEEVKGQTVVLIDDVITTGATMLEARKTLISAGARRVLCFAVAH